LTCDKIEQIDFITPDLAFAQCSTDQETAGKFISERRGGLSMISLASLALADSMSQVPTNVSTATSVKKVNFFTTVPYCDTRNQSPDSSLCGSSGERPLIENADPIHWLENPPALQVTIGRSAESGQFCRGDLQFQ
jgi:hypothetical protein